MNEKPRSDDVRRIGRTDEEGKRHRVNERAQNPLREGQQVRVRRRPESGGMIEDDWEIRKFMDKGSNVVVRKLDGSLEKTIPIRELEELNPEK